MLLTEREMKLPIDLMYGRPPADENNAETSLPEYIATLEDSLRAVHEFARKKL